VLDAGTDVIVPAVTRGVSHTGHVVSEHGLMFTVAGGGITQRCAARSDRQALPALVLAEP
jgi:hypothetical protein